MNTLRRVRHAFLYCVLVVVVICVHNNYKSLFSVKSTIVVQTQAIVELKQISFLFFNFFTINRLFRGFRPYRQFSIHVICSTNYQNSCFTHTAVDIVDWLFLITLTLLLVFTVSLDKPFSADLIKYVLYDFFLLQMKDQLL